MRGSISRLAIVLLVAAVVTAGPSRPALASPVATDDTTYALYGRVFPDPHGCVVGLPGKSPFAKGRVCATQFIQYPELLSGLRYLDSRFGTFMEIFEVPGLSAGIPTTTLDRERS